MEEKIILIQAAMEVEVKKIISELLGHSNVSITLNTYVHPTMKMKRESVEKLVSR